MRFGPVKHLPRTLRFRLTFWNTIVILVLVGVVLWSIREGLRLALLREFDTFLKLDAEEVARDADNYWEDLDQLHTVLRPKVISHSARGWYVRIFDTQGKMLWTSKGSPDLGWPLPVTVQQEPYDRGDYRVVQQYIPAGKQAPPLLVRVGVNREPVEQDIWRLTELMLVAFGFLLVMAPLFGYWLAGRATRPLAQILQTAARLHPEDLSERLPRSGTGDELDQLSATMNGMLDRLAAYLEQQRTFVANAAHELRSPLTAMRTALEVTLERDRGAAEYRELLTDLVEECVGLANLINHLLLLAEGEAGLLHADGEVRLDELVSRAVDMFQGIAEQRDVSLHANVPAAILIPGNPVHLREVLHNLIDNALKFTPSGGRVQVEVGKPQTGQVQLLVRDTGIGIPSDDLPKVFERFYRADKSRQREQPTGGNGLGLSICRAIVQSYGGQITIASTLGKGTTVTVSLPAENSKP
jgi:two-component system, OmpR family, heavy metal sensor histidine kinase CusS